MKNIKIMLFALVVFISFSFNSNAGVVKETSKEIKEVGKEIGEETKTIGTQIVETTGEIVDGTKTAIKTGVHQVDTSSNFRQIYGDLKTGVSALAKGLGVAAEFVFTAIVRKHFAIAVSKVILFILSCFGLYFFSKNLNIVWDKQKQDIEVKNNIFVTLTNLILMCLSVYVIFTTINNFSQISVGLISPESYAIDEVVNTTKELLK